MLSVVMSSKMNVRSVEGCVYLLANDVINMLLAFIIQISVIYRPASSHNQRDYIKLLSFFRIFFLYIHTSATGEQIQE